MFSKIPAPFDSGFRGEFKTGSTFRRLSRPIKLTEKINSKII